MDTKVCMSPARYSLPTKSTGLATIKSSIKSNDIDMHTSLLASLVVLCAANLSAAASNPACTKQPYSQLSSLLATYKPALRYCSSKYPVATATTTATITVPKSRAKRTAIPDVPAEIYERAAVNNAAKCSSGLNVLTKSVVVSVVKTVCACIETTPTSTVTTTVSTLPGFPRCDTSDPSLYVNRTRDTQPGTDGCSANCRCQADADGENAYCTNSENILYISYPGGAYAIHCHSDAECPVDTFCNVSFLDANDPQGGYCYTYTNCTSTYGVSMNNGKRDSQRMGWVG